MPVWEPVIGLEVHAHLKTRSKIFCRCENRFGADPNTLVCAFCLGYPGTLPVLNSHSVDLAATVALALGCEIQETSVLSRKNYFYADLPKGYQISQFDRPLARRGALPLVEIVSEPDIRSAAEAEDYLRSLHQVLLFTGASDGNMEEGSLRWDANNSLKRPDDGQLGTRVEVKNLNAFRNVARAVEHECARQTAMLDEGQADPHRVQSLISAALLEDTTPAN